MTLTSSTTSAIVLAGGQSQRLGRDKAFLSVEGEPLVARTVRTLATLSDDVLVVANERAPYEALGLGARLVPDERPGLGSLMGIYSGLKAARHDHAVAVACDMPFLHVDLLAYMAGLIPGYDVVIPQLDGLMEPLHAVYGKGCLGPMRRLLDAGRRQIIAFFPEVRVRYVGAQEIARFDPDHLSFVNVNTAEDWARVQALLEQQS
jgi:molybdopterin-guanine dinucleotide biosynthesis protein A